MRSSVPVLCAGALALLSCSSGGTAEDPHPTAVEPASGPARAPTRVTIRGDGFLARPSERQSGGGAELDTRHRAWLGDTELEAVTWIDVHTLEATVPAGLAPGPKQLVVENALGRRGALDGAFEVIATTPAALEATLGAAPALVNTGQPATATLTVRNGGGTAATAVAPDVLALGGTAATGAAVNGPSPASVPRLEPGATATFTWSVTPAVPGTLSLSTRAHGADAVSSAGVTSAMAEASIQAQLPAELTATLAASPSTANVGQELTVTLTLANGGTARADITSVTPGTTGPAATCGAVSPAPPQSVSPGSALQFTWTCTASAPGSLGLVATAAGLDGTSGAPLSATPQTPAQVTVQTPAALEATLAVQGSPASVVVGQSVAPTLTMSDSGQAGASVTSVEPTFTPTGAASCTPPSPTPPQAVAGLGNRQFTWTCTPLAAGNLSLGARVAGTDANTGAPLQATAPAANLTVLLPAALTATVAASRSTADVGQAITVTFTLTNGGTATANVTSVTPSHAGTATATCGTPSPAPAPIAAGGSSTFTWTCTASTAGSLTLSGTATGTDAVSGAPLSATPQTPAQVTVQTPAALSASLAVQGSPASVVVGQAVNLTLTVSDTGQAGASVTSVEPTFTPTGAASCTAPTPAPPQPVAGLGTRQFTWSCTPLAAGNLSLGARVAGTDANTGAALQATAPAANLTVLLPAALTATVAASRSTADVGQAITVTFTLTNGGTATANVTSVTPSHAGTATATCGTPSPAPAPIAAGGSSTFTWTCTASTAGSLSLSGTATGTDAVSGAPLSATPASPAVVTVQTPATLSASIVADQSTVVAGQAVGLTLTVTNGGGAGASISSVAPTTSGSAAATCGAATPAQPVAVAGGASATFTWTCTPSSAGTLTATATVTGADVNTGAALQATPSPGATVTVTAAGSLTVTAFTASRTTLDVSQPATVTLTLSNGGGATADVTAIAPSMAPAATPGCGPPAEVLPASIAPGASATFTWTCSASTAGAYALGASVTTSPPLAAGPSPIAVTVQTPALFAPAALQASRATADVGQPFTVSLVLSNSGQAAASVTAATLTSAGTGAATCGAASPAPPQSVAGGASLTLSWACTGSAAGTVTFSATVTAVDANTGADVSPTVTPVDVVIQTPAVLTAALSPTPSGPVPAGTTVTLTLSLTNTGQATARVGSISTTATPGGGNVTCSAVSPAPPQTVAGEATLTFTWTCTLNKAATTYTFGATVGATDLNTGAALTVPVTPATVATN